MTRTIAQGLVSRRLALRLLPPLAAIVAGAIVDALTNDARWLYAAIGVVLWFAPVVAYRATRAAYAIYLLDERRPRSWLLGLLVLVCAIVTVASFPLALLGIIAALGISIPAPWGLIIFALMVVILESTPSVIEDAVRRRLGIRKEGPTT
jgi:hypothetical protein